MGSPLILAGDLGGTKTLVALAELTAAGPRILREARYDSRSYSDFPDLLTDFLEPRQTIAAACFGLAGPTDGLQAQLTYLPWQLDADDLGRRFDLVHVRLANDFAAAAHGLELLAPTQLQPLQSGRPVSQGPRLILGAGTGLGVAGLVHADGRYRVIPGEGGHMGFAPQTAQQHALWQHLHARTGRVTTEDVVSGPGIARIHGFLGGDNADPATIGNRALMGDDPVATATIELWLAAYGAFAGDLALHWLARGGVFIAGGIAAKLLPKWSPAAFLNAFNAKREHAGLAAEMPIHLVTEERLGLLGALALAVRQAR